MVDLTELNQAKLEQESQFEILLRKSKPRSSLYQVELTRHGPVVITTPANDKVKHYGKQPQTPVKRRHHDTNRTQYENSPTTDTEPSKSDEETIVSSHSAIEKRVSFIKRVDGK